MTDQTTRFQDLEVVVLARDIDGWYAGKIGTVVNVWEPDTYLVEVHDHGLGPADAPNLIYANGTYLLPFDEPPGPTKEYRVHLAAIDWDSKPIDTDDLLAALLKTAAGMGPILWGSAGESATVGVTVSGAFNSIPAACEAAHEAVGAALEQLGINEGMAYPIEVVKVDEDEAVPRVD